MLVLSWRLSNKWPQCTPCGTVAQQWQKQRMKTSTGRTASNNRKQHLWENHRQSRQLRKKCTETTHMNANIDPRIAAQHNVTLRRLKRQRHFGARLLDDADVGFFVKQSPQRRTQSHHISHDKNLPPEGLQNAAATPKHTSNE